MQGTDRLVGIQAARGVAALAVVLYHAGTMVSLPQYVGYIPFGGFFNFGHAGVDFFFVLSGFIIYFVHHADIGKPRSVGRYIWRRVTRIYPIYWIATAVEIASLLSRRHGNIYSIELCNFLKSIALLPGTQRPIVDVAWTLQHEILFYAAFSISILSLYLGITLLTTWGVLITFGLFGTPNDELVKWLASPFHLQFLMGVFAAYVAINWKITRPLLIASLSGLAFFSAGMIENLGLFDRTGAVSQILFGVCAAFFITGLAAAEQQRRISFNKIGEFFGGASYSLYLFHTILIGATYKILEKLGIAAAIPGFIVVLIGVFIALLGAALLYSYIERPITIALNRFGRDHIFGRQLEPR